MRLVERLKEHSEELGKGVHKKLVRDLEARLDITLPEDFKEYLYELNYAAIFGDPIYGINPDDEMFDIYSQNKSKEHFRYGFLEIFANDIDGTIYIRPDTGAVYNSDFGEPIAKSFTEFVEILLRQGS
ncbi:SMI1/KNR4 family protein [Myxococcota bacterium]|nr:SMI1/KNR4 family protein [Myxococcota bacterium]MBU1381828.1 SMI1/KNR4 family protein [Myxococcota bacterium]MBU1498603.1 SMI1/KNR4 family protein [Myxococcota bacterium]